VQWRYLHRAGRYASSRNVSMIVTRIRDNRCSLAEVGAVRELYSIDRVLRVQH
jgi:hypothetical protein